MLCKLLRRWSRWDLLAETIGIDLDEGHPFLFQVNTVWRVRSSERGCFVMQKYDVAVIGGGIIGMSTAYYLTLQGKKVLILEAGIFGAGASGACDDMILFQSKKPGINLELAFESLELYHALNTDLRHDLGFEKLWGNGPYSRSKGA